MPVEDAQWRDDAPPQGAPTPAATATGTTSRGPSGDDTPDQDLEPHRGAAEEAEPEQQETPPEAPAEFDPKVRQDFDGLLYLGKLERKFHYLGHEFLIRTLTTGEILEVGLLHKQYADTLSDVKAYQAALVAAAVVTVDGKPLPGPLTVLPSDTGLRNRFEFILNNWFPSVLDKIYQEYLLLEDTVEQVMDAMGNRSR